MTRAVLLTFYVILFLLFCYSIDRARSPIATCAAYQDSVHRNPMRARWVREQWQRSCRWTE